MGWALDPNARIAAAARDWIVRLTSGEMDEAEFNAFKRWSSIDEHDGVFRIEIEKWRNLEAIRHVLEDVLPLRSSDSDERSVTRG